MTRLAALLASIALAGAAGCAEESADTRASTPAEAAAAVGEAAARDAERLDREQQKAAFDAALAAADETQLEALAEAGNAWALHRRALQRLESGERILADAGFIDMEAAAENGNPDAQLWVGLRMARGSDGYPLKPNSGLMMVERAAAQGHVEAMFRLGELYEADQFMADADKALEWYGKAAAAGSTPAREALDRINDAGPPP
jgi:TPR repeat protein